MDFVQVYHEIEGDVINSRKRMHYALNTGYDRVKYPQSHDFFEMLLVLSGRQELTVNGVRAAVGEGTLALLRPGEVHSRRYLSPGQHINFAFSAQIAQEMFTYLGNDFPSRQLLTAPALLYVVLDRAQVEDYRDRFDQINMIPISEAERSRTLLRALLMDIFARQFVFSDEQQLAATDWFRQLMKDMKTPDALCGGINTMVELSGRTHEHLCRVFRQRLEITPTEFVNDLRLTYAANRLLHTSDSIIDICFSVGFESLSHFYHLFRDKYGKTPRKFREKRDQ